MRITIPFFIIAVFMIALPMTAEYVPNKNMTFWIILLEICMFYLALGVMQSSIFALGGILPGKYMGAIMMGNGFSAIFISLVRGICLLFMPSQLFLSVLIYFIIAALCMVIAAFVHIQFQRNSYVRWHLGKTQTSMEAVASPKNSKSRAQNTTLKEEEEQDEV
jgi:NADH:ubiquinone oxidoreductase subunit 6 (subunit J)